jgi:LPS-assembly protein
MCVQADQLLYDARSNRVIAQGNVEIYYNNFILTADQVIYDRSASELVAESSVQLKNPDGAVTRGDRLRLTDDYRDAFSNALEELSSSRTRQAYNRKCSEILKTAPPHLIIRGTPPSARFP